MTVGVSSRWPELVSGPVVATPGHGKQKELERMDVYLTWLPDDGPEQTVTVHDVNDGMVAAIAEAVAMGPDRADVLTLPNVSVTPGGPRGSYLFRAARVLRVEVAS